MEVTITDPGVIQVVVSYDPRKDPRFENFVLETMKNVKEDLLRNAAKVEALKRLGLDIKALPKSK